MATTKVSEKAVSTAAAELQELAYNLWWSWNPAAQQIFEELSPYVWESSNHNPVEVLQWVSKHELHVRLQNPAFHTRVSAVLREYDAYVGNKRTWTAKSGPTLRESSIAYFSAEFGLHESLRIYSGGLGVLAGDHAKSASDLGLPLVGMTLFYRHGYFQQQISGDGWQMERYPSFDPARLPISPVLDKKGERIICSVEIGTDHVQVQAWAIRVGRITVYMLDTDLTTNEQKFRDLTAHVYGGDNWTRIAQEIVLGIGGVRMLRAMGVKPLTFHMNEGHSAFLTLELLRERLAAGGDLSDAETFVRQQCVFTTHTPVPAGHDRFDGGLMTVAFPAFIQTSGLSLDQLMRYGREHPDNPDEPFTMTVLALRFCRSANGVSELHGKVSQNMWKNLYPQMPVDKIPIGHVTNGIHTAGWTLPTAGQFWTTRLGPKWNEHLREPKYWRDALSPNHVTDDELWALRTALRRELIEFARMRLSAQSLRYGNNDLSRFDKLLSPDVLTIGFARRFATYKRAPLFFRDFEWALRALMAQDKPVQLIFAGKAHPRDDAGKRFIQEIVNISQRLDLFGKVVFVEDYDINVARHLVAGSDVWLNTPRRPMEASGTSGMKIAIHGGLHLSTMDGWWREAYDGHNGWKIGEDTTASNEQLQDDLDAASLRAVLEQEVIPLFYDRGKDGIPHRWLRKVRHAMASLIPVYNTDRMVVQYAEKYYASTKKKK
ncbi:MAG TPA: alpha-glucan family phosphorylase [Bacteroidota bacterium]|nr:alpha-glucan family phosphorylase [Bacteroidota bacterium]